MQIIDILKRVCLTLSLTDEEKLLEEATKPSEEETLKNEEIKKLLNFLNLTLHELCVNYVPVLTSKEAYFEDKSYPISELTNFLKLQNIKKGDRIINHKFVDRNITVKEDGVYTINYYTYPTINSLYDNVDFLSKLSPDVLVFGVISFYCLSKALFDEFKIYNSKYRECAEAIKNLKIFELPKRIWQ